MTLFQQIARYFSDTDKINQFAHGDENTVVETDGGPVRSIAKFLKDNQAAINAAVAVGVSTLIGWTQAGIGAIVRTVSDRLRDTVSVLDYADYAGATHGDGVIDDYGMFARALAANPGKSIFVPNPSVKYTNKTGKLTIPPNTTLAGSTWKHTQFSHEFNGDMFEMSEGAAVDNFKFPGNGATYTGRCFVYSGTAGRQRVQGVDATDWDDEVQYYGESAGSQCLNLGVTFARRNALTGTGRYAVVISPVAKMTAVPRRFISLDTNGMCAIDFGGCNNTFVSCSVVADLKYWPDTRAANVTSTRILNQFALTYDGHNNVIAGCDILPQITIAPGADNCHLGANTYNTLPIVDNSGNNRNTMTHWAIAYTPVLTTGGTAASLGNGTITGWVARTGGMTHIEGQLVIGSTTNLGTGGLRVSTPQTRHSANVFVGGTVVISQGAATYTGFLQIVGGGVYVSLIRDTTGAITYNSPIVFAAGATIRWSADFLN